MIVVSTTIDGMVGMGQADKGGFVVPFQFCECGYRVKIALFQENAVFYKI